MSLSRGKREINDTDDGPRTRQTRTRMVKSEPLASAASSSRSRKEKTKKKRKSFRGKLGLGAVSSDESYQEGYCKWCGQIGANRMHQKFCKQRYLSQVSQDKGSDGQKDVSSKKDVRAVVVASECEISCPAQGCADRCARRGRHHTHSCEAHMTNHARRMNRLRVFNPTIKFKGSTDHVNDEFKKLCGGSLDTKALSKDTRGCAVEAHMCEDIRSHLEDVVDEHVEEGCGRRAVLIRCSCCEKIFGQII